MFCCRLARHLPLLTKHFLVKVVLEAASRSTAVTCFIHLWAHQVALEQ